MVIKLSFPQLSHSMGTFLPDRLGSSKHSSRKFLISSSLQQHWSFFGHELQGILDGLDILIEPFRCPKDHKAVDHNPEIFCISIYRISLLVENMVDQRPQQKWFPSLRHLCVNCSLAFLAVFRQQRKDLTSAGVGLSNDTEKGKTK